MSIISIPKILHDRLTEAGAEALANLLNQIERNSKDQSIDIVESRFEKRLSEEIGKLRVEMHAMRTDIIRWMFIFWVGQTASVIAIVKLM